MTPDVDRRNAVLFWRDEVDRLRDGDDPEEFRYAQMSLSEAIDEWTGR